MPSQHKYPPIAFRPPEGDRAWLLAFAAESGRPVNAVLAEALSEYRAGRPAKTGTDIRSEEDT